MDSTCPHNDARKTPLKCLGRVLLDAAVIVGAYAALSFALDKGSSVSLDATATFVAVFVPIAYAIKALDMEYHDQLARVAAFHLGTKVFNVLTMGPV